ncbi:MAG: hypothetical protein WCK05_00230 [Planctomycetota bacterium]
MERLIEILFALPAGALSRGDEWSFALAGDLSGYAKLGLIAAVVFLAYVTIRSYRREGDAPRRAKTILAGLRIAAILLAVSVLLRPAVVVRTAQTLYRTVIVLVDNTYSMGRQDDYTASAQEKPLAQSLGLPPSAVKDRTRLALTGALLGGPIERISADHRVVVMAFGRNSEKQERYTRKLGEITLAGSRGSTRPAGGQWLDMLAGLKADGLETDLAAALWDALEEGRGYRVDAIVLAGDGQDTALQADERLRSALQEARKRLVPIHTVCLGDERLRKAVTDVVLEAPPDIRPDGETDFLVRLSQRHCDGQAATVSLLRREKPTDPWSPAGDDKPIVLQGPKPAGPVEPGSPPPPPAKEWQSLSLRPKAEVRRDEDYTVEYKALVTTGGLTRESSPVPVTVSDRKINVLFISGDGGWEFQRLKDLLYRSSDRYQTSIWQQDADPEVNQVASTGMKISRIPRTLEELMGSPDGKTYPGYQVVILYDPQPTTDGFDETFIKNLETFVTRHKGGLCYIAGNKYSEGLLVGEKRSKALAALLPVELARNPTNYPARIKDKKPVPMPLRLTVHGVDHPVMRLADDLEESKGAWGVLPGVYWSHPVARMKLVARELAVNPSAQTSREAMEPVVAVMPAGGKVMYMGTDETWRWLFVGEGKYYRRFWHNTMRYLAPQTKARRVVLYTEGEQFYQTEKVTVFADVFDKDFQPSRDETFTVEVLDARTGLARPIVLKAIDPKDRPGQYKGVFVPEAAGTFKLTAMRSDPLGEKIVETKRVVIKPPDAEVLRPEADPGAMARIAGPNALTGAEAARLAERIPPGRVVSMHDETYSLWDSYAMLGAIVALLTAEWILRKRHNMI